MGHTVSEQGEVYYPYIGNVQVAGLTVRETRDLFKQKLSRYIRDPQVDVRILEYRGEKIFIGGAVRAPGNYHFNDIPLTIAEALNRAGGYDQTQADLSQVNLLRDGKVYYLDLLQPFEGGENSFQICLKPGDQLKIPSRDENKIYILGGVNRVGATITFGAYRATLKDAIGEAGGISLSGDANQVYILRRESEKSVGLYHLDLSSPVSLILADRFRLRPRDIIYVDLNGLMGWNTVLGLLLPTVSATTTILSAHHHIKHAIRNDF
jgi:polysaccharide export outer membrane protein